MRNALPLLLALVFGCTGDDLPPPSSPGDPAYARAPETRFDPGPNPLVRSIPPSPGAGAAETSGHSGHGGGGAAPASSAAPAGSTNPHAGHPMAPAPSGSSMPMTMPMPKMP